MLLFNRKPFFELDNGPAGSAPSGTPPVEPASGPASGDGGQPTAEPVQSAFAQYMGLDLTSIPEDQRPAMIERLKQVDSAFSPAMMKFKPWTELVEQGITPEQARQALAVQRLLTENPQEALRMLQAMLPPEEPAAPSDDPLASLNDYGDDVVKPVRTIWEKAQRAEERIAALEQQIKQQQEASEKDAYGKAIERAESGMTEWLGKNKDFTITPEQMRAELKKAGKQGIMAGFTATDYEAAALRALGPEKYGEIVYARKLAAARQAVGKAAPGPVVTPGAATGSPPAKLPSINDDRAVLEGAMELINGYARQSGG
jgi:hypothetical protein